MRAVWFILKLGLKILAAPVVLALALFTWVCFGLLYVSSFVFGLASTVVALLGIAVLVTYSPQNGVILLVIAFLVSPLGLPMAAWLVGKGAGPAVCDPGRGVRLSELPPKLTLNKLALIGEAEKSP